MPDVKKSRLPKGRGIRKIDMPQTEAPPTERDTGIHVEISETDREILNDIRARLETQYGTPFSDSQIIRWAVWHCP